MTRDSEPRLRDQEPLRTIRAHPKRFAWGTAIVFLVSLGCGVFLARRSLALGIAVQLLLQTAGLLWLYLPVAGGRNE